MKKNVLITGGSGFIGKHLTSLLISKGYSVSVLTRFSKSNTSNVSYYLWDVSKNSIEEEAVLNADYIVHLAGENIAEKRWTTKRKAEIVDSREQSIQLIYSVLRKHDKKPEAFISASGIGIYGAVNGDEVCTENTPPANDFLGSTCQKWEAAVGVIADLNIRTVKIRTGLVLGKDGGFLKKIAPIFKYGFGSGLGSGKQYMPWIHIDDLCEIYFEGIVNRSMTGAYNATVDDETTNTTFSKTFAIVYEYSIWLPNIPAFLIELGMGEMAKIVLTGRKISSDKIKNLGFQFQFANLECALRNCLKK